MIYLQLSGIQHFMYCTRQWALITIEQVWEENEDTVLGQLVHQAVDNPYLRGGRDHCMTIRSVPVRSKELGLTGIVDSIEFYETANGLELPFVQGRWAPHVVEYKKGKPKKNLCDISQLVAQVMCLEEMHRIRIDKGTLYYKTTNQRMTVDITDALRGTVRTAAKSMQDFYLQGVTPVATIGKNCQKCSLRELCWPRLTHHRRSVSRYVDARWEEYL